MVTLLSLFISSIALFISGLTFYYSRLQEGTVKMTRPSLIFFGPEGPQQGRSGLKKVFIRTLLFGTSDRGQHIQNMFVHLKCGETVQHFNVWAYNDKS